ncbi:hypothetical protein ES708_25480 [subsurface metagenome]
MFLKDRRDVEDRVDSHGPAVHHRREEHDDVSSHQEHGHDGAGAGVVAELEVLRHGVDAGLEELRQEPPGHEDERDGRHPLVTGDGEAHALEGRARHPHEVLGRDVRGDQREADERPGERPAGQEVVEPRLLAPAGVQRDHHDREHKSHECHDVEYAEFHARLSFRGPGSRDFVLLLSLLHEHP